MDYARNLCENVKAVAEANGISIRQLAANICVPASSLTDSLKSKKGLPVDLAIKVCDSLGFTVEQLSKLSLDQVLQMASDTSSTTEDEEHLLSDYRQLNRQGKEFIRQTMVAALNTYKKADSISNVEASTIG